MTIKQEREIEEREQWAHEEFMRKDEEYFLENSNYEDLVVEYEKFKALCIKWGYNIERIIDDLA